MYVRSGSGYTFDDSGHVTGWRRTQDGHGGRAEEHHREMQEIAEQTIQKIVPQMIEEYGARVWSNMISQLHGVLTKEINSIVRIGIEGCKDIFYDSKTQKYISDTLVNVLMNEIHNIKIK